MYPTWTQLYFCMEPSDISSAGNVSRSGTYSSPETLPYKKFTLKTEV